MEKTMEKYPKNRSFEQIYSLLRKNYGTMEKTMVLYRKLWNFDLLWKKLRYYGKNHGTIVNFSKL